VSAEGYNADKVWTYEGGEKWRSADGKVTFNAGVYYNKWNNIQQLITPPCGFGYTANAGDAATYGPEAELAYKFTDELTLQASGTHTHATITSAPPGSSYAVGQKILNIPDYQAHIGLSYRRNLSDRLELTARADESFVGQTPDISYTYVTLPSYSLTNLRLGFEKDRVSMALYVDNATNKHAELSANNTGLTTNIPSLYRIATNQPRTAGVNFKYSFRGGPSFSEQPISGMTAVMFHA
jgi:iron complex outermembrane recepter protein